ncbi:MAG: type 1 fimbrial protein [Pseudomonas sp.]|nr:type 1 fimbrial protein [Pseudomonas sp.]
MINRFKFVATSVSSIALMFAASAYASDGTITFTGKINGTTCAVAVNGGGTSNTVTIPAVGAASLNKAGAVGAARTFVISATDCAANSSVRTNFEFGANVDTANASTLKNALVSSEDAKNVNIQLVDAALTPIEIGGAGQGQSYKTDDAGNAMMTYGARYYATGVASQGDIKTDVTYSVEYM